ncbi:MAG TPA: mannitol dehydrogenase family protein [Rhizomicrobium sp.]|jgi:mannitol-1-phosphate/altronate dehydrogenase
MLSLPLSRATLAQFKAPVRLPAYDPATVTPGIVHLGLGGFHRAHMARYTHDVMERRGDARHWGILGAGLMPADRRMRDVLTAQDGLYTLVERSGTEEYVSIIGAIARVIFAGESSAELLDAIDGDGIRIVSTTVTENGYGLNRATKLLDRNNTLIAHDLANPRDPLSVIGIVTEAYRRRMAAARRPFTALCCDNIQHNGNVLKRTVLDFAKLSDPDLAAWIEAEARFPNTMVDRITPVTRAEDVADLTARYGIEDGWPVFSETFTQWVIEDNFVDGRPAWEDAGAQFVTDVTPYEFMKLRLLNTSHLAVAALGRLMGYQFIHQTMADPTLRHYMIALMDRETGPTLLPAPGVDLPEYKATLIERFANPAIMDTVERVNTDAPLNILLDPIRDRLVSGEPFDLLALALAAWLRRARGVDEQGKPIDVRHPLSDELRARAVDGGSDPRPLLGITALFGDLGSNDKLVAASGRWLRALHETGAARTLARAAQELQF